MKATNTFKVTRQFKKSKFIKKKLRFTNLGVLEVYFLRVKILIPLRIKY